MRKTLFTAALMLSLPLAAHAATTHWKGSAEGMAVDIKLDPATTRLSITGNGHMCVATVDGKAEHTPTGVMLVATTDNGQRCEIPLDIDAAGTIKGHNESPACMAFHGASCSFNFVTAKPVN